MWLLVSPILKKHYINDTKFRRIAANQKLGKLAPRAKGFPWLSLHVRNGKLKGLVSVENLWKFKTQVVFVNPWDSMGWLKGKSWSRNPWVLPTASGCLKPLQCDINHEHTPIEAQHKEYCYFQPVSRNTLCRKILK